MTLRKKTLLIVGAILIFLIAVLYAASFAIVMNGFKRLEQENARRDVQRAVEALAHDFTILARILGDMASSNDACTFMQGANPEYVRKNIATPTFDSLRLNLILFLDPAGRLVFGRAFDLEKKSVVPLPQGLEQYLGAESPLLQHPELQGSQTGFVLLPQGPLLLASRAILTSDGTGPSRGTMIIGRFLDRAKITRLGNQTNLDLSVHRLDNVSQSLSAPLGASFKTPALNAKIDVQLQNGNLAGHALLPDFYGKPALLLHVDLPRTIYQQGLVSIRYLLLSLLVVGLVFGAAKFSVLEKLVLSRLSRLSATVNDVGVSGDPALRVPVRGNDELASLATAINGMLEGLEKSQHHLQESEERYRTLFEASPDAIFLIDGEVIVYCNPATEELFQCSQEQILGATSFHFSPEFQKDGQSSRTLGREYFQLAMQGIPQRFEWQHQTLEGRPWMAGITLSRVLIGGEVRVLAQVRNITARKRIEADLEAERQRLFSLLDGMPAFVCLLAPDHRIRFANRYFREHFGHPEDRVCFEILAERTQPCEQCQVFQVVQTGQPQQREFIDKNGCTYQVYDYPFPDTYGSPLIMLLGIDITQRKQAEAELRKSLSLVQATLESTADGILVQDSTGKISWFNQKLLEMWRMPENLTTWDSQLARRFIQEQVVDPPAFFSRIKELYQTPDAESFDTLQFLDGRIFERYSQLQRLSGRSVGRVWSFRDVTQRQRAEAALRYRVEMEQIIATISTQFINLPGDDLDVGINRALCQIVEFTGVDGGHLFQLSGDGQVMRSTHEWCAPGISSLRDHRPVLALADYPWWREQLQDSENIYVPRVSQLPPEAAAEKKMWEGLGIRSLIAVPLAWNGSLLGCLVFCAIRQKKSWAEEDLSILQMLGEIFSNAMARRQAQKALRESEKRYKALFEGARDAIFILEAEGPRTGKIVAANQAAAEMHGYSQEELKSRNIMDLYPLETAHEVPGRMKRVLEGKWLKAETIHRRKDGTLVPVEVHAGILEIPGHRYILAFDRDISERKKAEDILHKKEAQLLQAQKMEAVGRLAGGVAHDFNNLLTAIMGYGEILLANLSEHTLRTEVEEVLEAADRAAALTGQLLAFSRRQALNPEVLDLNAVVVDMEKMLRRIIGEDVELATHLAPRLERITADRGQIGQVIMNLAVNARDAMPEGGRLTISTQCVVVEPGQFILPEPPPGRYVCLTVADTGVGMDKKTREHIFEPFFTTKAQGEGTGLGLSTAYGIVTQHGGCIQVYSEPGHGATFKIYLQATSLASTGKPKRIAVPEEYRGQGERVLLVEDEENVRKLAANALKNHGYKVSAAATTEEALGIFEKQQGNFQLVFSDVVMPGQSGTRLVEQLLQRRPELRVVLTSGYTDEKSQWAVISEKKYPFIQKPYSLTELLRVLKEALK